MKEKFVAYLELYGPKLVLAIATLVIGLYLISMGLRLFRTLMNRRKVDPSLVPFTSTLLSIGLKVMLFISVASMVGIETTSFVAILGAAGLAIGLALQGSLSNFAGGVLILIFKPFKVGEYVEAQGYSGSVKEIQIFNTTLLTPDNKVVVLPNGSLANGAITNYSREPIRRVDFVFGVSYSEEIPRVKGAIEAVIKKDSRIMQDPAPFFRLGEMGPSSIDFKVRVWAKTSDYWDIYFDMLENMKTEFDRQGISIPFPQMDVHLRKEA